MAKPPIEPKRWQPPRADFPVPEPTRVEVRRVPIPQAGEDPAIDPDGNVYTGLRHGEVIRVDLDGKVTPVARVGADELLGVEWHPDGWLVVCSVTDGVFRVDPDSGRVEPIQTDVHGRPFLYTENSDVLDDGTIVFSEASDRWGHHIYRADYLEHSETGSLFATSPNGDFETLLTGLSFANGVAKVPGEDSVLVAETSAYRIRKYWLGGPKAGQTEMFVDGFPGMFDNLSVGPTGTIWGAVVSTRVAALDFLLPRAPAIRKLIWRTPEWLQPNPPKVCKIAGFDVAGNLTHWLEAPSDQFHFVTGVREHDGKLWIASLEHEALGVIDLPA